MTHYDTDVGSDDVGSPKARRKKAFALADALGLTRDERIDLAETLLWRDLESWQHLSDEEVSRLLDAMEGGLLIAQLFAMRHDATLEEVAKALHPASKDSTASAQSAPAG